MRAHPFAVLAVVAASAHIARADTEFPHRLGPSASASIGAGYSFFESENGGVSVLGMADLGWFVSDRIAVLAGATLLVRPGDEDLRQSLWRLGVEYRADGKHYFRLSAGRSWVKRERDELDTHPGMESLGNGEGVLLVAGVPAPGGSWSFGEVSVQFVAGAEYNHGDDTQSTYAAFLVTALELAFR